MTKRKGRADPMRKLMRARLDQARYVRKLAASWKPLACAIEEATGRTSDYAPAPGEVVRITNSGSWGYDGEYVVPVANFSHVEKAGDYLVRPANLQGDDND